MSALQPHPIGAFCPSTQTVSVRDEILTPIVVDDHWRIIDGRARRDEAVRLGKACPARHFDPHTDGPLTLFVARQARQRLTVAQAPIVAAWLAGLAERKPAWLEHYDRLFLQEPGARDRILAALGVKLRTFQRAAGIRYERLQHAVFDNRISAKNAFDLAKVEDRATRERIVKMHRDLHKVEIAVALAEQENRQRQMPELVHLSGTFVLPGDDDMEEKDRE
ncbi:hypothetical protein [Paraburkholderia sp. EG304]|uniref:hypothetical protein n=1 Tax=Paraburkholderia sp. EG304 TaxID=3237015 RepID=UPI0039798EAD